MCISDARIYVCIGLLFGGMVRSYRFPGKEIHCLLSSWLSNVHLGQLSLSLFAHFSSPFRPLLLMILWKIS